MGPWGLGGRIRPRSSRFVEGLDWAPGTRRGGDIGDVAAHQPENRAAMPPYAAAGAAPGEEAAQRDELQRADTAVAHAGSDARAEPFRALVFLHQSWKPA